MEKDIVILVEKVLKQQANAEELAYLKQFLTNAKGEEVQEMLSGWYQQKWEEATFDSEKEVEERIWEKLQGQIQTEPTRKSITPFFHKKFIRIAASILIPLLCVGLGYYISENRMEQSNDKVTVEVETGQKASITLPDGTSVWINSSSLLTYDNTFNKKNRTVYLQGEAHFDVRKKETCPFIVNTNDVSIEALGTNFDVKAYPDDNYVMATLIEGSILVSSPFESDVLKPNEKLTFSKNGGEFSKTTLPDAEKSISWINNKLAFEQERLGDIAKTLERMYHVEMQFEFEELKNIRFSGLIQNNNLENILLSISFVAPIDYSMENNRIIITRSK